MSVNQWEHAPRQRVAASTFERYLLRSPDGHPPGRHTTHPHPSKMMIHLTHLHVVSQSVGANAVAAHCCIYLRAVLLRSPDGHPPGRHMTHPPPQQNNIHLTQPQVVSQSVGACAAAARCRIYLRAVLLRSPDGHPPGRHTTYPHPSKMTIHLTQPHVIWTPHRTSPTSRFPRTENPSSRITRMESSHITVQPHLALAYHAGNRSHPTLPEQPLVRHMVRPAVPKDPPQRPSTGSSGAWSCLSYSTDVRHGP